MISCAEHAEKGLKEIRSEYLTVNRKFAKKKPRERLFFLDYLCQDCREHFDKLQKNLELLDIKYEIDNGIVRGLDYYTKTVFEIISGPFTVCGGGRYDGLVEEFGGDKTPAIGFGLGIERLLIRLDELGVVIPKENKINLYVVPLGEAASRVSQKLSYDLRKAGVNADTDHKWAEA